MLRLDLSTCQSYHHLDQPQGADPAPASHHHAASVPAIRRWPHLTHHRRSSTDSTYQPRRWRRDASSSPRAPYCHTSSTNRGPMPEVGGQNTTDYSKMQNVQPAARVVSSSAMVKHVSNSGPTAAHVLAQCVNGGVAHDHEDAVEALSRQCDNTTQAAADSKILLPLTAGSGSSLHSSTCRR